MLKSLKITNPVLAGKTYKPRFNSLNKFYSKALKLQREFIKYEEALTNKKLLEEISQTGQSDAVYVLKFQEYLKQRFMCYELFLTTDIEGNYSVVNAEALCEVMLEDSDINHSQDRNAEEFAEYLDFLMELLSDFFLNYSQSQNIENLLAKIKKDLPQEMNSQTIS